MRTSDVEILIVPGWSNSGPDHWQSRWARNLRTARRVEQDDWDRPERDAWVARIAAAVDAARRPAVLVGHSCGVPAIVHAASVLAPDRIAGAMLVAPTDLESRGPIDSFMREMGPGVAFPETFLPLPMARLPFPALVVASSSDPFCTLARARIFAEAWGAELTEAGDAGHINTASGHGPWPEGLLRFGAFLKGLG